MPETQNVRERIIEWKNKTDTSYDQIALMVNKSKQVVYDAITGRNKSPESNLLLLNIIKMFGIK